MEKSRSFAINGCNIEVQRTINNFRAKLAFQQFYLEMTVNIKTSVLAF